MSYEFLFTSLIVVLLPGAGVIYTVSTGLFEGWRASIAAAFGCTAGIVPHLVVSSLGLSTLLHTSALAFQVIRLVGAAYLLFLAWTMWRETGSLQFSAEQVKNRKLGSVVWKAILVNLLNPKLSVFFLSFLPLFIVPILFPHQAVFGTERGFHADDPGNLHPVRIICPRSHWVSDSLNFMEGLASTRIRGDLCGTGS